MKIYNKKNFLYGLGMTILGVLMLLTSIWKGFDVKGTVILALCLFVGIGLMLRSLSRDMSREDKIAELDERNKMVEWRAKSRALGIAELICVVCILVSIVGMRIVKDFFVHKMTLKARNKYKMYVYLCCFNVVLYLFG